MPHLLPAAATAIAAAAPAAAAKATVIATLKSVAFKAITNLAISAAMSALQPQVGGQGGRTFEWTIDPDAPIPFAAGRVGVAGSVVHRDTFGPDLMYYGIPAVLSGAGPITGYDSVQADDYTVTFDATGKAITSTYAGELWFKSTLGNQPDVALSSPTGLKHGATLPGWTSQHKLSGKAAYMVVMGENSKGSAFPTGEIKPLITFRGLKGWDPRLDSTYPGGSGSCRLDNPATWVYLTNPILWALKWSLGLWEGPTGKGAPQADHQVGGIGAKLSGIDVPAFVAAANVADANGWTVSAYPNTDDDKHQVLEAFLQAGGAIYSQRAGKISCIQRAAPRTSIVTISAADTAGPLEIDTAASRIDRINTIRPRFWSPAHRWQMTAMDEVTAASYQTEDGGKRTRGIDYPFVSNAKQAGQLAALQIANTREGIAGVIPLKPHLQRIRPGDAFTITEPGFVLNGLKCLCLNTDYDPATGVVRVSFVSETDQKYPFALGQDPTPPEPQVLTPTDPTYVTPPLPEDWVIVPRPPGTGGQVPGFDLSGQVGNDTATAIHVEWWEVPANIDPNDPPPAGADWQSAGTWPPTATTIPIDVQPDRYYWIGLSYVRNQNYSERTLIGPWLAGKLIADDVTAIGGQPVQDVLDRLTSTETLVASVSQAVDELGAVYGDTASAAASAVAAAASEAAAVQAKADAIIAKGEAQALATTAAQKATDAAGSALAALTSKNDAAASATTATQKATDAAGSAATATQQAGLAAGSATAAGGSATAAAGSASTAATKANEAGNSATAADASKVAAESARDTADQKATAAAQSASSAATSSTQAGQSASAAQTAKTDAETARAQAQTFRNEAADSATNAAGSAATASSAASQSVTAKDQAQGFATAANTSAQNAAGSATAAGNSASAANTSKTAAEAAYSSAVAAAIAGMSDVIAADTHTASQSGSPLTKAGLTPSSVANGVYTHSTPDAGTIFWKQYLPWKLGEVYDLEVAVTCDSATGAVPTARLYGGVNDAAFAKLADRSGGAAIPTPVGQTTVLKYRVGMGVTPPGGVLWADAAGAAWAHIGIVFNRGTGLTAVSSRILRMSIRNVTALVASEGVYDKAVILGGNQGFEEGLTGWGPNLAADPGVYTDANRPAFFSTYQGRSNVVAITLGMGRRYTNSVKLYPINTARKYRFRGAIYAGAGSSPHSGVIGYIAYDADNKRIGQAFPVMAGTPLPPNTGWYDSTSGIVTGEGPSQYTQFPPGTKKIQLHCDLNYYGQKLDVEMALDGIWIEDVTESENAKVQATASATSAASAAASATLAGEKATAAQTAKTAAETAKGLAETAATQASSSATNAAGSAASASSAATNAATSRDQASGFATAASGSASTASTKANEAGNSAAAAAASQVSATAAKDAAVSAKDGAETARGQAQSSATAAATSASNASASETAAGQSATASAGSATTASTKAGEASTFASQASTSAANANTAAISAGVSATSAASRAGGNIVAMGSFSDGTIGTWTGSVANVAVSGVPDGSTRALRSTGRDAYEGSLISGVWGGRRLRVSGYGVAPGPYPLKIGIHGQTAANGSHWVTTLASSANTTSWATFSGEIVVPADVNRLRPFIQSEGPLGAPDHHVQVATLRIEDVTESASAANSAAVATSQAASASASAASASISADLAASTSALRGNLLPNGGMERGLEGINGPNLYIANDSWGPAVRVAPNGNGTYGIEWAPVNIFGGATYTVSGDALLFADSGSRYFDMQFLDSAGAVVKDSGQKPMGPGDYSNDMARINAMAFSAQAPANATRVVVRAIFEGTVNPTALGARRVKLELGNAPATAYTADSAVDALSAQLNITAAVAADAQSRMGSAAFEVLADSGGDPAQLLVKTQGSNSLIQLVASALRFGNVVGGTVVDVMKLIGGEVFFMRPIYIDVGDKRLIVGPGGTWVLWFGGTDKTAAQATRTNGFFAFGTDGKVYYGSAELGGGGSSVTGVGTVPVTLDSTTKKTVVTADMAVTADNMIEAAFSIMGQNNGPLGGNTTTFQGGWEITDRASPSGGETVVWSGTWTSTQDAEGLMSYTSSPDGFQPARRALAGSRRYSLKMWRVSGTTTFTGAGNITIRKT